MPWLAEAEDVIRAQGPGIRASTRGVGSNFYNCDTEPGMSPHPHTPHGLGTSPLRSLAAQARPGGAAVDGLPAEQLKGTGTALSNKFVPASLDELISGMLVAVSLLPFHQPRPRPPPQTWLVCDDGDMVAAGRALESWARPWCFNNLHCTGRSEGSNPLRTKQDCHHSPLW